MPGFLLCQSNLHLCIYTYTMGYLTKTWQIFLFLQYLSAFTSVPKTQMQVPQKQNGADVVLKKCWLLVSLKCACVYI